MTDVSIKKGAPQGPEATGSDGGFPGRLAGASVPKPTDPVPLTSGRRVVGRLVIPPKRYKVGELAAATGLSRQTLHNYTKWGLIDEVSWTDGGHRLYDESVFARLEQVMKLKATRTVQEVRALLAREAEEARQAQEDAA